MSSSEPRWRVKAYSLDPDPEYGEWTADLEQVRRDVERYETEAFDWIYVQERSGGDGPVRDVAFDGEDSELPSVALLLSRDSETPK